MKKTAAVALGLCLLAGTAATTVWAKTVVAPGQTVAAVPWLFNTVPASGDIRSGNVTVEVGQLSENPKWELRHTVVPVLVQLISESMVRQATPTDNLWKKMKARDKAYKGVTVRLKTADGHAVQSLRFFNGKITAEGGRVLSEDAGRHVEFWLYGTARIKGDQLTGGRVMPTLTFDQCRIMGSPIVFTQPRQCLLPDDGIILETEEKPTVKSLKARDFDSCLIHGQSLIYTFPRRCVAAGGRVFTEPPRVYEAVSATEVLSTTTPKREVKGGKIEVSATVPVSATIENVPGMGAYAVSSAAPTSMTVVVSGTVVPVVNLSVSPSVEISPTVSATIHVSATVEVSASVLVTPSAVVSPVVAPLAISLPLSTSVVVSSAIPDFAAPVSVTVPVAISATVNVSATPVVAPVVSPTVVSPTASVSSFEVTLGK